MKFLLRTGALSLMTILLGCGGPAEDQQPKNAAEPAVAETAAAPSSSDQDRPLRRLLVLVQEGQGIDDVVEVANREFAPGSAGLTTMNYPVRILWSHRSRIRVYRRGMPPTPFRQQAISSGWNRIEKTPSCRRFVTTRKLSPVHLTEIPRTRIRPGH